MARTLTSSAILLSGILFTNLSFAGTGAQKAKGSAKSEQTPAAVEQLVPLQAPSPEQMPAQPPQVTYHNGLLAISADNSNLADVLRGVRSALGIGLDTPPGTGSERVVVHLGPGQPRDVLTQLLAGSHYDYILVGTPQDSHAVSQVILTPREGTTVAGNVPQTAPPQPTYSMAGSTAGGDDDTDTEDSGSQPEPSAAPQIPPANPYQPNATSPGSTPPPAESAGGEAGPNHVKTPEQLLQELQRMQQQQQQNNSNSNSRIALSNRLEK